MRIVSSGQAPIAVHGNGVLSHRPEQAPSRQEAAQQTSEGLMSGNLHTSGSPPAMLIETASRVPVQPGQWTSRHRLDWLDQLCYLGAVVGLFGVLINTLASLLT